MNILRNDELVTELIQLRSGIEALETVVELIIGCYEVKENQQTITLILYLIRNQLESSCKGCQDIINQLDE